NASTVPHSELLIGATSEKSAELRVTPVAATALASWACVSAGRPATPASATDMPSGATLVTSSQVQAIDGSAVSIAARTFAWAALAPAPDSLAGGGVTVVGSGAPLPPNAR